MKSDVVKFVTILLFLFCRQLLNAKEGMWIPSTLKNREAEMKAMGIQIPTDQIFNSDGTGLNNAIVLFGRGCTGEIISDKGLILTNHHCGYGSDQRLSSADKDYFAQGFWASSNEDELPCPGLSVTFIRNIENVTNKIIENLADTLNDKIRDSIANGRIKSLEANYKSKTGMDAIVKPFFQGNQFWIIISETYSDIRLVGFPPNGIGNFGGDVENWVWPRHTGDFSLFRVYADSNNKPTKMYAKENKPYLTNTFLSINISGIKEGDFTMIYGFPGTTDEYAYSGRLNQVFSIIDPINISARDLKLATWKNQMKSRDIFLKYTAKYAGVANGWKKWQGEVLGLKLNHVTDKKKIYEKQFETWAKSKSSPLYAKDLLPQMRELVKNADSLLAIDQCNKEALMGVELFQQTTLEDKMLNCFRLKLNDNTLRDTLSKLASAYEGFYKNYDLTTDKKVFKELFPFYIKRCGAWQPLHVLEQYHQYNKDFEKWADDIYNGSMITSYDKIKEFVVAAEIQDSVKIKNDPAWKICDEIMTKSSVELSPKLTTYYTKMRYLNRLYLNAQMEKDKKKNFYPDANLTLRIAYGKVEKMKPDSKTTYPFQTTLKDVMAQDDTTRDIFRVPQKLKDLYAKKDFGRWGVNGDVPVAFIASNHTSGGNSGSPVLNGKGELIGLNFDRAYEGTMSDYFFDPNRCRNISVDVRYVLFIIEKFGGADWLLNEMKFALK